jgi:trimethylamine:corrinoid methyltransferase-like protein
MMSVSRLAPQPLAPLGAQFRLRSPPKEQLDELVGAALGVLERTGLRVRSPRAVGIAASRGAHVGPDGQTVRLAPELVRAALLSAPRTFVLASRDGSCDLDLSLPQTHCTVDGCAVDIVEAATGTRRMATKADLAAITRVVDYLGSLGFWWPDTFRAFSLEKLLLDDDLYHRARHALLDADSCDIDTILNVIDDVGPGGSYLVHRHTRDHVRAVTPLTVAQQPGERTRYRDPVEEARERGLRIIADYEPEPLDESVRHRLAQILAEADRKRG